MSLSSMRNELAKLRLRPTPWRRKPTTAEQRQELDAILARVESLPPNSPPHPDGTGLVEARAALDRLLAEIDRREKADAEYWARPWSERHGAL